MLRSSGTLNYLLSHWTVYCSCFCIGCWVNLLAVTEVLFLCCFVIATVYAQQNLFHLHFSAPDLLRGPGILHNVLLRHGMAAILCICGFLRHSSGTCLFQLTVLAFDHLHSLVTNTMTVALNDWRVSSCSSWCIQTLERHRVWNLTFPGLKPSCISCTVLMTVFCAGILCTYFEQ